MFTDLFDFSVKRNNKQAFGFYLAYLLLIALVSSLLGTLVASDYNSGKVIGGIFAIIINPVLCFMILYSKNLISNYRFLLLSLFSGILSVFGGGLLGLIPAAYLTTKGLDN